MFHPRSPVEALTLDSYMLCLQVMAKVAYNFWPCIAFMLGYCIWEHLQERSTRVRIKTENAKNRYRRE
jgi:hypothetical protein